MIPKGTDGIDHINIYSQGKTELGRWLSNFAYSPIQLAEWGSFKSVEGFWYYIGTRDERLRDLYGYKAKELGKSLDKQFIHKKITFETLIKYAIDIKLKSNRSMLIELRDSTLPLAHYYEYSDKQVDAGYEWITEHIENRRQLLKDKWLNK